MRHVGEVPLGGSDEWASGGPRHRRFKSSPSECDVWSELRTTAQGDSSSFTGEDLGAQTGSSTHPRTRGHHAARPEHKRGEVKLAGVGDLGSSCEQFRVPFFSLGFHIPTYRMTWTG